jgi:hypothetical protein
MTAREARYIVRFAAHVTDQYRKGFLSELSESSGATTEQLTDGRVEITGFRSSKADGVLADLKQEERRGTLRVETDA